MYDNYGIMTGDELNNLLEQGYTIASDGALLPPGVIEQLPDEPAQEDISMPYSTTMHIWADVEGSRKKK